MVDNMYCILADYAILNKTSPILRQISFIQIAFKIITSPCYKARNTETSREIPWTIRAT